MRQLYDDDLPPANVAELPPTYYDHVHTVFVLATFPDPRGERSSKIDFQVPELDDEGKQWVVTNLAEMHHQQFEKHPVRSEGNKELEKVDTSDIEELQKRGWPDVDPVKIENWRREYLGG